MGDSNLPVSLKITDLSRGGAGVSRDETGRVVFVPFSAPGDRVEVKIVEEDKRYAQGEILKIVEPSPDRQVPRCPAFTNCGGCQWQHLPYDRQWETKVNGVLHALSRVQISIPDFFDHIPAERVWEYRNRIQLRGEGNQLGFFRPGSRELVPINRCDIARPEINAVWEEVRSEGSRFKKPYKVEVEVLPNGEIRKTWNSSHSASGFRQIHDDQNEKLKSWIYHALDSADVLYDLFGGSGNLSLSFQSKMKEIHCVDVSSPRTRPEGVSAHFYFHRQSTLTWVVKEAAKAAETNQADRRVAILDPPREGLGTSFAEIAKSLEILNVREIVAVGCDPDSWARDISRWVKRGWKLKKLMAIDLFPQTHHIEAVGLLVL